MTDHAPDVVVFDGRDALLGLAGRLAELGHRVRRLRLGESPEPDDRTVSGAVAVLYRGYSDDGSTVRVAERLRNAAAVVVVAENGDFGCYLELIKAGAAFYYELAEGVPAIADGIDRITRVNSPRLG